jgi:AraC-like DNA-binding protein
VRQFVGAVLGYAIDDVSPREFNVIVLPVHPASSDATAYHATIAAWLAHVGPEVQIVQLLPEIASGPETRQLRNAENQRLVTTIHRSADVSQGPRPIIRQRSNAPPTSKILEKRAGTVVQDVSHAKTPLVSERIEAAVQWLNEHYADHISVSEIARRASMSERNFLRRFKAEVGRTPREYLARLRLEGARKLLAETDLPAEKIARHCGLFNGDHLRKLFLKQFGMPPGEYRAAILGGIEPISEFLNHIEAGRKIDSKRPVDS